jgi:hypothetical protein
MSITATKLKDNLSKHLKQTQAEDIDEKQLKDKKMSILIDTFVIVDALANRKPWAEVA